MSKYHIGIDLHKAIVQVCVLNAEGDVAEERRFRVADREDGMRVLEFLSQWAEDARYVVEAVGCDRWFVNAAKDHGFDIIVADPSKLGLRMAGKKTDRRDAHELARRLRLGDIDRSARTYYLEQHKRRYMDLLLKVSMEGAWIEWIEFFLDAVRASAVDGANRAKRLLALRQEYVSRVQSARSSALLVKLIDELFHRPSITFSEAAELLGVTPAAANANVRKLQDAGVLMEITGQARNMIFAAQGIFELVHDSGDDGTAESSQE